MWPANNHTTAGTFDGRPAHGAAVIAVFFLHAGTGSFYGNDLNERWPDRATQGPTFNAHIDSRSEDATQRFDIRSPSEHIENIRKVLDPALSDLAALFGLTRQAIYKWINGASSPDETNLVRVVALSQIADRFRSEGIPRADYLVKMKIFAGRSLMDLVKDGEQTDQHLTTLIAEAKAMSDGYQRSGAADSKTRPSDAWKSSVSIPTANELS